MKKVLIFLFLPMSLLMTNCSDDVDPNEETNNRLDGEWDVESYRLDGVEQMQYLINSFKMDFMKETATSGEAEWTIIDVFGSTNVFEGDYEIMDDGSRIEFEGDELNIEINGSFLTIDGNVNGYFWEIDAERD